MVPMASIYEYACKVMLNDSKMGWFTWLPRCLESFLKKLKRERKRVQDTKEGTRCQWGSAPDDVETIQRGLSTSLHVDRHRSRRADACRHVQAALEPFEGWNPQNGAPFQDNGTE